MSSPLDSSSQAVADLAPVPDDPAKDALVASRDAVRAALRRAREAGDLDLVRALRQLDVIGEATLRARGQLEPRQTRHYWDQLKEVVRGRPELGGTLGCGRTAK